MEQEKEQKTEIIEEEVVIPEETIKGLVDQVTKSVTETLKAQDEAIQAKVDEAVKALSPVADTIVDKGIGAVDTKGTFGTTRAIQGFEGARKELRFGHQIKAFAAGNADTLKHMNDFAVERIGEFEDRLEEVQKEYGVTGRYLSKASYNNETTNSEGRYLIPDPEFLIAVERYEAQYGVAFAEASVRTTDRISIKANKGIGNVTLTETGEGAQKPQTKPTYDQVSATMRKFTGITVATDEFIDDQAAAYWDDVTQGFARARARKADEIVFTEDDADTTKRGILNTSDVITETVGSAATSITWDDLLNAEAAVLPEGKLNAKFVMHRSLWNTLLQTKGTTNDSYRWVPEMRNSTPWGTPVVISELFRSTAAGENNQPYALYGDLSKLQLWVNKGLVLTYGNEGTVGDINLFEQDMTALRAVTRMTKLFTFPERFVVLGTGSVS